jgi:hypothetical protein
LTAGFRLTVFLAVGFFAGIQYIVVKVNGNNSTADFLKELKNNQVEKELLTHIIAFIYQTNKFFLPLCVDKKI